MRPPQPESVSKEGYENKWVSSTGKDRYRRGLYTFIQRTSPCAQNVTFDGADPSSSCVRRERSNTSLQALTLLNDPVFFEAARALAVRLLREGPKQTRERLDRAFRLCFARSPTPREADRLAQYYEEQRDIFARDRQSAGAIRAETSRAGSAVDGIDAVELAAWTGVSSVLLNLHEFITRE